VLPQNENISDAWIEMIADGDKKLASSLHEQHVDRLGNLTLSGYNSQLAAAPFPKKQALSENRKFLGHSINIGYRNGLELNKLPFKVGKSQVSLATAAAWTPELIEARTNRMCGLLMEMYKFEGIE
jgi:hypothetical protein